MVRLEGHRGWRLRSREFVDEADGLQSGGGAGFAWEDGSHVCWGGDEGDFVGDRHVEGGRTGSVLVNMKVYLQIEGSVACFDGLRGAWDSCVRGDISLHVDV